MCAFKLINPGLPAELWDAFDSDDESDGPVEDQQHAIFNCPGYMYAREQFEDLFQSHISPNLPDIAVTSRTSPALPCQQFATNPSPSPCPPPTPQLQPQQAQPYPPIVLQQPPFNPHMPQPQNQSYPHPPPPPFPHPPQHPSPPQCTTARVQ